MLLEIDLYIKLLTIHVFVAHFYTNYWSQAFYFVLIKKIL